MSMTRTQVGDLLTFTASWPGGISHSVIVDLRHVDEGQAAAYANQVLADWYRALYDSNV